MQLTHTKKHQNSDVSVFLTSIWFQKNNALGKRQAYMLGTVTHSTVGVSIAGLDYWADLFATIK